MYWFAIAALLELLGCYAVWLWLRDQQSFLWIGPAVATLLGFAWALTHAPSLVAGRTFAAYAGVYLVAALLWMAVVDRVRPDRWDLLGAALALAGAAVILYAPRIPASSPP
jgi:small multidrug resistance family-3 protein